MPSLLWRRLRRCWSGHRGCCDDGEPFAGDHLDHGAAICDLHRNSSAEWTLLPPALIKRLAAGGWSVDVELFRPGRSSG
jgi:hypothetical protein